MSLADAPTVAEGQRLRELFEAAPGLIAVVRGPNHVFEFVNDAYRRLVGDREFVGRPARDVFPDLEGQGLLALLDEVYRTGRAYVGERVPATIRRDGDVAEQHFFNFVYQPIKDRDGRVTGIFAEGIDVTEAIAAEASRRAAERRLDAVLNNASVSIFLMSSERTTATPSKSGLNSSAARGIGKSAKARRSEPASA